MNRKMRRAAAIGKKSRTAARLAAAEPDFLSDLLAHGWHLLAEGGDEQAMEIAVQALHLRETEDSKAFFVQCVRRWSYFPGAEKIRDVFVRALREAWSKPSDIIGTVRGLLDHDPVIGPAIRRAFAAWPRRLPFPTLLDGRDITAIEDDPLLLAVLESSKFVGVDLECFLTSIRAGLSTWLSREGALMTGKAR